MFRSFSVNIPIISRKEFDLRAYGAVGDGRTSNTAAFRKAIEAAAVKATLALLNEPADKPLNVEKICSIHAMMSQNDGSKWGELRTVSETVCDADGTVVYSAPPGEDVAQLMQKFCDWWNTDRKELPAPLGAAFAHLFFVEIHPFEDGNGRMARMLFDKALADTTETPYRPYSMSLVIEQNRGSYYRALDKFSQDGDAFVFVSLMIQMQSTVIEDAELRTQNIQRLERVWEHANANGITITPVAEAMLKTMAFDVKRTNWSAFDASRDIEDPGEEDAWEVWDHLVKEGIIVDKNINYEFPTQYVFPAYDKRLDRGAPGLTA